jgi:hypothetical protein
MSGPSGNRHGKGTDPILARLLATGASAAMAALVTVAVMIFVDVGGIGSLIGSSEAPLVPLTMLAFAFVVMFTGVAISVAVMRTGEDDWLDRGDRRLVPIPVRARRPRRW